MLKPKGKPRIKNEEIRIEIRKKMEEINKRAEVEFDEDSGLDFLDEQREKFRELTHTKSVKKFATGNLSRMNRKQLTDILEQQKKFLKSAYSQRSTRKAILEKKVATNRNIYPDWNIDKQIAMEEFYVKRPKILAELMELGKVVSEDIRDLFNEYNDIPDINNKIFWAVGEINNEINDPTIINPNTGHKVSYQYLQDNYTSLLNIMVKENTTGVQEAYEILQGIREDGTYNEEF